MKKKTLKLNDLRVKSFVTNLSDSSVQTVKGGIPPYSDKGGCDESVDSDCGGGGGSDICSVTCVTVNYLLCDRSIGAVC